MSDEQMQVVMGLIMEGGNAKNFAMQAIQAAQAGNFEEADKQLKLADESLGKAHNIQTDMLTKEAQGEHTEVNLYMVHAQDWLMTSLTFKDMAATMIDLYHRLAEQH
ncbi:PTS lactose/cellobiose transporter subunit IIA [Lacticaseibacillus saniviri]|uniref:Uncharacterized protein n=1 Tax=Lacticaseibacillus saniviri JCM 17471 = DSM 24301 TaxID=1293598 RepID=A0A0R2MXK4_9LACO|nr:PTS lactose/cellobiose transporter subunit IIA [Lacticaseibacillus saniviri]KRO16944.1 hypothetical protein IV56_GL000632 [Lacticaseibacillus saniviri JCM 17471 = DSM 24301]MCG4281045.1 PTS lactose/cellobiose transporter subunit IIA [Lacticaseibacillus saniviri]